METSEGAAQEAAPQVVFRANKRRKVYRQRDREADDTQAAPEATRKSAADAATEADRQSSPDEEGLTVAEALRRRNARKAARLRGVEFRAGREGSAAQEEEDGNPERALVPAAAAAEADPLAGAKRFAPQTGLVGELVNKHMEEYIESQLARRHAAEKGALADGGQAAGGGGAGQQAGGAPGATLLPALPPAKAGKLQEIDLGDEARARNVAMTEMARRRLAGLAADDEAPLKQRLGPDGKPWRGRKRRGSEDIKRDQLVEEFLRENKLDVYDLEAQKQAAQAPEDEDEAADDRIAEEFRREFMEAMSERVRRRRRPAGQQPSKSKPGAKKDEEILRGPKLGGSRNVRSAMRDLLLQQQEAGKKRR
ncbi:uncharacterized protein E0L32_007835 [Thyridium curvatum]|uniref:Uncharacterized protein n=1 Tax=Thyridium curvatum TaxID=1093900 RepID=A0A507AXE3_9PEZI|nr:uncharacterized protein E0L32_007835 [Thyridium curvatum]TPX11416.1 hypothetical protein E0L32_007835 [Thyridium curvatum]